MADVRPLQATTVLAVSLEEVSAKVRPGRDDREITRCPTIRRVILQNLTPKTPSPTTVFPGEVPIPNYVTKYKSMTCPSSGLTPAH